MYKGIECQLYPNQTQQSFMNQTFGHTRFVWNQMLHMINERYKNNNDLSVPSFSTLSSLLPTMKQEYPWLKDGDSIAIQNSVKTLRESFDRFFKKQTNYPRFKSGKIHKQSYTTTIRGKGRTHQNIQTNEQGTYIKLPKLGWVKCKTSCPIDNDTIMSVTITRQSTGTFTASVLVGFENQELPKTDSIVGVDFGLTDLLITSDGQKEDTQRLYLEYQNQLHYWEKRVARRRIQAPKQGIDLRDSKNYQNARRQVAKIQKKIANKRKDRLHKITKQLVEQYDVIVIEDLRTSNLLKNNKLSRAISNQSWRQLRTFLEYKCKKYGKELIVVNPYKTSQYCSSCGHDSGKKTLDIRTWVCPSCAIEHDRDINAAINILNKGLLTKVNQ